MGRGATSHTATFVNSTICASFLLFGAFYPAQSRQLYYATLLELFLKFEVLVMSVSLFMMLIGKLFGERIQNKRWEFSMICYEILETTKCMFVVAGLTTIPVMRARMGLPVGVYVGECHDSYLLLLVKTILIWIAADCWTYMKHWSLHRNKKYLYQFHKQHHAFSNPTSFASFAISPLEAFWTFCPIILFSKSLPVFGELYLPLQLSLIVFFVILNIYLHCGYTIHLVEAVLPYIYLNTSAHHNVHHETTNYNFGEVSPFFDYVTGNYHRGKYLQNKHKFGWVFFDFSQFHEWDDQHILKTHRCQ